MVAMHVRARSNKGGSQLGSSGAESEEVAHKKARKGEDVYDEFNQDEEDGLEDDGLDAVDKSNIISAGTRTRGKRFDYTEDANAANRDDNVVSESEKGKKARSAGSPIIRSPEKKTEVIIKEGDGVDEEDEEDEDEDEYGDEDEDGEDGEDLDTEDDEEE
ncbi:hypothetical protein F5148DRAFT_41751 [Russula earlei]|uniref:Uncharacterized protein n=1 Tax=Russula earlei TaxID=71964 RepID=A0ACC0U9B7_9AGAM|nr:hypothetical protein F5148DRAFT_41751 [Russula earlei]